MDYFKKYEENPAEDLAWNIPEQKQGKVGIVGGNSQNFRTEIKIAEFLGEKYPIEDIRVILPDALRGKLPELPNLKFLASTESGSFANGEELAEALAGVDVGILLGDLSKNTITGQAVASACKNSEKPLLVTRDSVDIATENISNATLLMNENLVFFASVAQLQKLLRAVYYPKMLMMSQSLIQVAEVLHKFTLSYPVGIVTLHSGQILVAKNGEVVAVPLEKSGYSPITFWGGELAVKIVAMNLYNPHNFVKATITAIFHKV